MAQFTSVFAANIFLSFIWLPQGQYWVAYKEAVFLT